MARYTKKTKPSLQTKDEAMKIARGTQRPGQTKEQTKLIAQGIQKGIDLYKRELKGKARELDRKLKKASGQNARPEGGDVRVEQQIRYRQHWLPWVLLVLSWVGIAAYLLLFAGTE